MIDAFEYGRRPRFMHSELNSFRSVETMQVCPGIELNRPAGVSGRMADMYSIWGNVLDLWEGYAADSEIRYKAASGGIVSALGIYAIEHGGYSGVLHITPRNTIPYLNQTTLSTTRVEVLAGAGSRYSPASPCDGLQMIEDGPKPCVVVGKPCDVAAVRKAMKLRTKLAEKIGLTIAFFCAGTPSQKGTFEMFKAMGIIDPSSVQSVRYRGYGWPGNASVTYQNEQGIQTSELTYDESWGKILQKYRQWRCYICPDHTGEFADIAVADAWYRSVADSQPGYSILIARTKLGVEFIQNAMAAGCLTLKPIGPEVLPTCSPWQERLRSELWGRLVALRACFVPVPRYRGFGLFHQWFSSLSIAAKWKSVLSTFKRIRVKRLRHQHRMVVNNSDCKGN